MLVLHIGIVIYLTLWQKNLVYYQSHLKKCVWNSKNKLAWFGRQEVRMQLLYKANTHCKETVSSVYISMIENKRIRFKECCWRHCFECCKFADCIKILLQSLVLFIVEPNKRKQTWIKQCLWFISRNCLGFTFVELCKVFIFVLCILLLSKVFINNWCTDVGVCLLQCSRHTPTRTW